MYIAVNTVAVSLVLLTVKPLMSWNTLGLDRILCHQYLIFHKRQNSREEMTISDTWIEITKRNWGIELLQIKKAAECADIGTNKSAKKLSISLDFNHHPSEHAPFTLAFKRFSHAIPCLTDKSKVRAKSIEKENSNGWKIVWKWDEGQPRWIAMP